MMARALAGGLVALTLVAPVEGRAAGPPPSLDMEVRLDPDERLLQVTATLRAPAGDAALQWNLAPQAGIEAALLHLPASPHARARTLRYSLPLAAPARQSHRDTLDDNAARAGPQGSFLPASSGWHPAPAAGGDFTYRLRLSLPAAQRGLVPGRLIAEAVENGRYVADFVFDHPAQGIDLMAGPYTVEERVLSTPAGVRLRTYFHAELQSLARDYLDAAAGYLARYSRELGDYPYTEFSIVSSPTPTGYGMPTLTYLGVEVLKLPFIRHTSLGHEVLHNWWGNGVYVDYGRGNWCEGLTTFLADYAYKEEAGEDPARQMRLAWLRDLAALPDGEGGSLRAFVARFHGASQIVGYHKAAMLFLMLRERLGAERFRDALRAFWRQYRFRTASWKDIQFTFEQSTGEALGRLFDETLDATRLPVPRIDRAAARPGGGLELTLRQDEPPALLRVPLRALGTSGSHDFTLELTRAQQHFVVDLPGAVTQVLLDPDLRLLRRLSQDEQPPILRQVMVAPRVALRLADADAAVQAAARALAAALLDSEPVTSDAGAWLLMGTHAAVDALLVSRDLRRPDSLAGRGSAQVWADRTPSGQPVLVVSARDAAALHALSRPLPHYGGQGFLVFDGAKAVERGQWPARTPAVEVR